MNKEEGKQAYSNCPIIEQWVHTDVPETGILAVACQQTWVDLSGG